MLLTGHFTQKPSALHDSNLAARFHTTLVFWCGFLLDYSGLAALSPYRDCSGLLPRTSANRHLYDRGFDGRDTGVVASFDSRTLPWPQNRLRTLWKMVRRRTDWNLRPRHHRRRPYRISVRLFADSKTAAAQTTGVIRRFTRSRFHERMRLRNPRRQLFLRMEPCRMHTPFAIARY